MTRNATLSARPEQVRSAEIEAALDQMYGYYSRSERIVTPRADNSGHEPSKAA